MLYPEFTIDQYPDQLVPEGTLMARVVDPYTFEELERLVAPFDGYVLWWRVKNRKCNAGEYAYSFGRADNAEWVRGGPSA
jgi:hypothetical protein